MSTRHPTSHAVARAGHDATPPADADTRKDCLDATRSFIVQAPAGAGKTELLIQRCLLLLAQVEQPEDVVAITFTRKAAAEMRQRILAALEGAHDDMPPVALHARTTWTLAREVLARDRAQGWSLERFPSRLAIATIDGLCLTITRHMPLLSRLGPTPALVTDVDAAALYRAAARATLQRIDSPAAGPGAALAEALATLLLHLDNQVPRAERLLVQMLLRRDQWLRHIPAGDSDGLRASLEAALERMLADLLAAAAGLWPGELWDDLVALARFAAGHLPPGLAQDDPLHGLHGVTGTPRPAVDALPQWQALAALLLTQQGAWRKRLDKRQGFPAPSTAAKDEQPLLKQQQTRMLAALGRLAAISGLDAALFDLRDLRPRYPDGQWAALEALLKVLPAAVADLRRVFAAKGAVDHLEIALSVAAALEDAPREGSAPARGADIFAQGIRHLLVDEFQDTSVGQHRLLLRLTAGWRPGDGRSVFLVGDPMQSIYAFREAEVGVFLRVCAEGLGALRPQPLQLGVNFRSAQAVVNWINTAFPAVLPARSDMAVGAVPYTPFTARAGAPGGTPVQVHALPAGDPEAEAERVVALVRAAQACRPGGTVAILVRTRGHLAGIVPALHAAGLRFRALDIDPLAARPVVSDLLALTRALLHRGDRIAWLAVLRAPWCGLTLADLLALAGEHPGRTVWACMNDAAAVGGLSADGQVRLARVTRALAPCLAQRARGPLRRQVERAWLALGGALGLDAAAAEDARAYLALPADLEQGGGVPTAAELDAAMGQLKAAPDPLADERLQIMTIHHAKGLEFDTVIVPGLGRPPRHDDSLLLAWLERRSGGGAEDLLLAPLAEAGSDEDPLFRHLKSLTTQKGRHEQGRLAYVAVTRAREELHLLGHARRNAQGDLSPAKGSLLETLWPVLRETFAVVHDDTDSAAQLPRAAASPGVPLRRMPAVPVFPDPPHALAPRPGIALVPATPPEFLEYSWAGDVARHVGTVVHRTLQQIGQDGLAQWNAAGIAARRPALGAALRQLGLPQDALPDALQRVMAALQRTLADERGRWVLGPHQQARSELALSADLDGDVWHVLLDRTFIDEQGTRWIVDYKAGGHESTDSEAFLDREQERYRGQLERYARIVEKWQPGRPIRLGLYFPLLQGWREWAAPAAPGAVEAPSAAQLK